MALPAGVSTCRVDLRLIEARVDGSDVDRDPDGIPIEGARVEFRTTLNPAVARVPSATPPTVISLAPVVAFTNADGRLISPDGEVGVYLIASADEDLDPHGWPWRVTITKPEQGVSITTTFITTPGGEIDLGSVVPVPPNPGTALLQWETAVTAAQEARDEAVAAKAAAEDAVAAAEGIAAGIDPTVPPTPSTVVERTTAGQVRAADPTASDHAATRGYVEAVAVPDGGARPVGKGELVLNVTDYPSVQDALDAATYGARVFFPPGTYAVPSGGFIMRASGLTIDAMGATFEVSHWGTPAFLGLRQNGGGDDQTYRLGLVEYVGTRGNHTGGVRGGAAYTSGCAVYTNGDRNFVEYVKSVGMPTPIYFSSWDGTSLTDRTGVGNRIGYMEASGYDFGLLYVKQDGYDWGNGYCHDDIDDSSGVNPTHAIYASGYQGHVSGTGTIGRWICERNDTGAAYSFKYVNRLSFDALVAHDTRGALSVIECHDLRGRSVSATEQDGNDTGTLAWQWAGIPSQRNSIDSVTVTLKTGVDSYAVSLWADDSQIGSVAVVDDRSTASSSLGPVRVRGNRNRIRALTVRQNGAASKAAVFASTAIDCAIEDVVITPPVAIPVAVTTSVGCRWNSKTTQMTAPAAPTDGTWTRGDVVYNSAPTAAGALGWVCVTSGSPGTWRDIASMVAQRTTTQLASAADTINTESKGPGRMCWNTTANRPVWATGSTATATWVYADGTTAHTPA